MRSTRHKGRNGLKTKGLTGGTAAAAVAKKEFEFKEDRVRLAFENAPIGMAIVDLDYRLRRVNKSLCEALGYEADELLQRRFVDITHPDDIDRDVSLARKLFQGELASYRLEKRFLKKDGTLAWLDLTALVIREDHGNPLYGLAMVENITEAKRSSEALRTSEERYRSFVINSSEGIWRLEVEQPIDITLSVDEQIRLFYEYGYLAECNDALARMYGHQRADDIVGSRFGDLSVAPSPDTNTSMRKLISSGYRLQDLQIERIDEKGNKRYFSSSLIGNIMNNMLIRVWGVQVDQTEQRAAKLALEHSNQQLRALSAHFQGLRERERTEVAREIHDGLGQSLTGVKIELSLLEKKLKTATKTDLPEIQEKLHETTQHIRKTISAVKNLATELRPGVLDKFGLIAAIEWQCQEFCRRFGIKCKCKLSRKKICFSPETSTALFRILQEALINVARHSQASKVRVEVVVEPSTIRLMITDNGRGITPAEIQSPTSLGLLGMRERAEFPGGTFDVTGVPGQGTVLSVSMPLNPAARANVVRQK